MDDEDFGFTRKEARLEARKMRNRDRSQYKKSDLKKKKPIIHKEGLLGKVIEIGSKEVVVFHEEQSYLCHLKGSLKEKRVRLKALLCIGDNVRFTKAEGGIGSIFAIEKRQTVLSRSDNLSRYKEHAIASNIDQVLVVSSFLLPLLKPQIIDRYLIAIEKGGMSPIIVINKIDLLKTGQELKDFEEQKTLLKEIVSIYKKLKIPLYLVSTEDKKGLGELKKALLGKSSVLSGQSGVGKSSLINALFGSDLRVSPVVEKTRKGAQTTTSARLIPIEKGGFCVDTPGIKSFGVWDVKEEDLLNFFKDIKKYQCRYADCAHIEEDPCLLKEAVKAGEFPLARYNSYKALRLSLRKKHMRR